MELTHRTCCVTGGDPQGTGRAVHQHACVLLHGQRVAGLCLDRPCRACRASGWAFSLSCTEWGSAAHGVWGCFRAGVRHHDSFVTQVCQQNAVAVFGNPLHTRPQGAAANGTQIWQCRRGVLEHNGRHGHHGAQSDAVECDWNVSAHCSM